MRTPASAAAAAALLILPSHPPAEAFAPLPPLGARAAAVASSSSSPSTKPPSSTTGPLPSVPGPLDTLTSGLASVVRMPRGVDVSPDATLLPALPGGGASSASTGGPRIEALYDVENDRECRAVRERITELDLGVGVVVPCAPGSRVLVDTGYEYALGGGRGGGGGDDEKIAPRLVARDADGTERVLSGEEDILSFLDEAFSSKKSSALVATPDEGDMEDIKEKALEALSFVGSYLAVLLRWGRGTRVCPAASASAPSVPRPEKPLLLYSYEGNQFCRLVREVLTELDVPYELKSAGKGSGTRAELAERTGGSTQCPYLVDPNSGVEMAESADIVRYLYKTYALWTPPSETLRAASDVIAPLLKPIYVALAPLQAGSGGEDEDAYNKDIDGAVRAIEDEVASDPVVIYTYSLSPFCSEATALLDNLDITYKEISLGKEWIPGLIAEGGAKKRAALGKMTGQTSLPHLFVGGKSVGGLFSGTPGMVPALEEGTLMRLVEEATAGGEFQ